MRRNRTVPVLALVLAIVAGQEAARRIVSAVVQADGLRAPERLAETGIERGRPFSPQYPLWTDGAQKRRWVLLPPGAAIDVADVDAWDFPVGTRFWKEFSFAGRKVETRMLWKAARDRWIFATYVWNGEGTDAVRAPDEGLARVADVGGGRRHSIPSIADCRSCHDARRTEVLGFNALQLSTDRDPNAIHGEPLEPAMITLRTLVEEDALRPARPEFVTTPPRIEARSAATRSVLGYLSANCGACHNSDGDLGRLGPSLKHAASADGDALARRLARHATEWQVPGVPEGESVLVDPDAPDASAMLARMRSRRPSSQMPPVGTVLPDRDALDAIARWIATDVKALDARPY